MHPLLSSKGSLLLYVVLWIPLACFIGFTLAVTAGLSTGEAAALTGPLAVLDALLCLGPWYGCRMLPVKTSAPSKVLVHHLTAAVVSAGLWTFLAKLIAAGWSNYFVGLSGRVQPQLPVLFGIGLLIYMLSVALHYVLLSVEGARESEAREQEARVHAREAELKALKAQINPHFLFNSLNSISALATSDGRRAREMCIRLSEFLRSTLSLGDKESITLEQELGLAKAYLDVEQVRFGARLKLEQHIDEACGQCSVPPLVLQPLVENAVKHGVAGLVEGGTIRLKVECANHFLRVGVENEFDPDMPATRKSGIGLVNVRSRLKTRYEDQARLNTTTQGNCYYAELVLPCLHGDQNGAKRV